MELFIAITDMISTVMGLLIFLWATFLWCSKRGDKQAAIYYMATAAAFGL